MNKLTICAIASFFVAAMFLIAGSIRHIDSLGDIEKVQRAPPPPVLPSAEEQALFEIAKNVPGIKAWAADGWQYLTMDFLGTENPAKWTHAIVHMKLPPTAKAQKYCSEGWEAVAKINLETMLVEDADFPRDTNAQCGGPQFGGRVKFSDTATTTSVANLTEFYFQNFLAYALSGVIAASIGLILLMLNRHPDIIKNPNLN